VAVSPIRITLSGAIMAHLAKSAMRSSPRLPAGNIWCGRESAIDMAVTASGAGRAG